MPTHAEKRTLPYSADQLFALVVDVDKYPEFLPWCIASRVTKNESNILEADLIIGYKMIREKFSSRVTMTPNAHVHVEYLDGPMKYLSNHWHFIPEPDGGCTIDFYVDFEFKNPVLHNFISVFFNKAVSKMVQAFEDRAKDLYSDSPL